MNDPIKHTNQSQIKRKQISAHSEETKPELEQYFFRYNT